MNGKDWRVLSRRVPLGSLFLMVTGNCPGNWGKPPERLGESHVCHFGRR